MSYERTAFSDELSRLSPNELAKLAEQVFQELTPFGYATIDVPGLMLGTRYRLQRLFIEQKMHQEKEKKKALSDEESDQLFEELLAANPRYGGPMLAETLRYQLGYDYKGVPEFEAHPFPEDGTPEYEMLLDVLGRLGMVLLELGQRFPDARPRDFLPENMRRHS